VKSLVSATPGLRRIWERMRAMDSSPSTVEGGGRRLYFFLSYAHTPTGSDRDGPTADLWVTTFYHDLSAHVSRLARHGAGLEAGFMASHSPGTQEWRARASAALGAAEVFVQLYSPDYLLRPWPLAERASFGGRMAGLSADHTRGHVQPVLWVPLAPGHQTPEVDEALELGLSVPEYAKNGLLAMCRLTIFREQYAAILRRLAQRIVTAAEATPLGHSPTPVSIEVAQPSSDQASFVIGVIAPTAGVLAHRAGPGRHGDTSESWHPFARSEQLPPTEYAAQVAQRLGLGTDTVDLLEDSDGLTSTAGIVLVDPWILAVAGGRTRLLTTIKALPEWAVLFILANEGDPKHRPHGEAFLADVVELLRCQQHVVKCARDASTFVQLVPHVVTQARRRFLSRAPMFPPNLGRTPQSGRRGLPRLDDLGT
jgi:FxsC-like protein